MSATALRMPLGPHWSEPESLRDTTTIYGVDVHLVGFAARAESGVLVTGSAAAFDALPTDRAYFELLERTSTIDALASATDEFELFAFDGTSLGMAPRSRVFPQPKPGATFRYSISNGVAGGATWASACKAAQLELAERDRVLGSWYGHAAPEELPLDGRIASSWSDHYDFHLVRFPRWRLDQTDEVAGFFALPRAFDKPFASGFAAAALLETAVDRAIRECIQGLGFLWDEPLPLDPPALDASPDYHQATYLLPENHRHIRQWLYGEHTLAPERLDLDLKRTRCERAFVDLTPAHLRGELWVVKALPRAELSLTFGRGDPNLAERRQMLPIHPIV